MNQKGTITSKKEELGQMLINAITDVAKSKIINMISKLSRSLH